MSCGRGKFDANSENSLRLCRRALHTNLVQYNAHYCAGQIEFANKSDGKTKLKTHKEIKNVSYNGHWSGQWRK